MIFPVYPNLIYARNIRYIFFEKDAPFNHLIGWINNCPVTESREREHCIMILFIHFMHPILLEIIIIVTYFAFKKLISVILRLCPH